MEFGENKQEVLGILGKCVIPMSLAILRKRHTGRWLSHYHQITVITSTVIFFFLNICALSC